MTAAALHVSTIPQNPTGWWISEKYDGVRAIWTGSKLITRNGKDLRPPAPFTAGLPRGVRLDGELWMGRGSFPLLVSEIQRKGADWAGVYYMVFDAQDVGEFEARQALLDCLDLPPHVKRVPQVPCMGPKHLDQFERDVVNNGGEGAVIVRPRSNYRPGREGTIVKVKRLVADLDRSEVD